MKDDNYYDNFIRSAIEAGFTDDQVNWLKEWVYLLHSNTGGTNNS